jgi:hypothetical protein
MSNHPRVNAGVSVRGAGAPSRRPRPARRAGTPRLQAGEPPSVPIEVAAEGEYVVSFRAAFSYDYGIFDIFLDGDKVLAGLDLYRPEVEFREISMGSLHLSAGKHALRFVVAGGNEARRPEHRDRYYLGIDYLDFKKGGPEKAR